MKALVDGLTEYITYDVHVDLFYYSAGRFLDFGAKPRTFALSHTSVNFATSKH